MKYGKIRIEDGNLIFAKRMLINYLPCKDILWAYMRRERCGRWAAEAVQHQLSCDHHPAKKRYELR